MIKHKQLFRHDPDRGIIGDCYRTAIACLLDLSPIEVPHVYQMFPEDPDAAHEHMADWLRLRGWTRAIIAWEGLEQNVDEFVRNVSTGMPGLHFILLGRSRNERNHAVICRDGVIVWDSSLDNSGIIGPTREGQLQIEMLVQLSDQQDFENLTGTAPTWLGDAQLRIMQGEDEWGVLADHGFVPHVLSTGPRPATDEQIMAWAQRYGLMNGVAQSDLRACFEDAQTLLGPHSIPAAFLDLLRFTKMAVAAAGLTKAGRVESEVNELFAACEREIVAANWTLREAGL